MFLCKADTQYRFLKTEILGEASRVSKYLIVNLLVIIPL